MADVTERMLALLSTLQTGRPFSGDELTRRLGVSPRTLRRDVDRLRGYGYPVETQPGPGGYYRLAAGRTMPPLVLDDDEAVATLLALGVPRRRSGLREGRDRRRRDPRLRQGGPVPARPAAPRAAAIRASLETSPQRRRTSPPSSRHLAEAIAHQETMTFTYTDARGDARTGGSSRIGRCTTCCAGTCWHGTSSRDGWRVFRLDRLTDPLRTGDRYAARPLPAESALDYLRQGLNRGRQPVTS